MSIAIIGSALATISQFIEQFKQTDVYKTGKVAYKANATMSLSDISKLTKVEPLTIVSKDLVSMEEMQDIQQAVLSIFTAHYLQAVNIIGSINNVEVIKALDRLNPNRDHTGFILSQTLESVNSLSQESYKYSLPRDGVSLVSEASDGGKDYDLNENVNLSVGRLIEVKFAHDEGVCRIPVNIRLIVSTIPNRAISGILAKSKEDNSLVERYHAWRSGRISFIRDLVFAQDLIDEHKRATISDETRTVEAIMRRVANNRKFGLLTMNPSLATASNIFVISEEAAKEVEVALGGKLSNPSIRNKAFENTYAMIIAVVDRNWNRVTFYTRNNSEATDLSFKEIKNKSGNKGPDLLDMMKSLNMGMSASF